MPYMELFKGDGRKTWQLRFTDHQGKRRQISTYVQDRSSALTISHRIELLIGARIRFDIAPREIVAWLYATRPEIREKLIEWGLVEARTADGGRALYEVPAPPLEGAAATPITPPTHVDLWEQELREQEVTESYAAESAQRVRALLALPVGDQRPIRFIQDITADGIMARIRELRRVGLPVPATSKRKRKRANPQTCEHYLSKVRQFLGWMVGRGYLTTNPLNGVSGYSQEVIAQNKSRDRRAFSLEEQALLITGSEALPYRWNRAGKERSLIYRLALRTGLRANEIRTLRVANFNFFAGQITVLAADAKSSRQDTLPIAKELAELLKEHFAGKHPQAPAFTPLSEKSFCKMLRADLDDLQIRYQDDLGRYADFHALRHTFGTDLARVVMPAVHQKLMRHKHIQTTMKYYTHVEDKDKAEALGKLPALPESVKAEAAAG